MSCFYQKKKLCRINFGKKMCWATFFHKLIWSPCPPTALCVTVQQLFKTLLLLPPKRLLLFFTRFRIPRSGKRHFTPPPCPLPRAHLLIICSPATSGGEHFYERSVVPTSAAFPRMQDQQHFFLQVTFFFPLASAMRDAGKAGPFRSGHEWRNLFSPTR
jgi:hypothetical protein